MIVCLRRVPPLAYLFLAFSSLGALAEVTYHFLPPEAVPVYANWLASLSPVDRDFFGLAYELIAHIFIAVGLMGMVAIILYRQLGKSGSN
ncbi:MAG TPA: hypothetical protein VI547_07865 [Anaerolineales bacterium]|nr:hypothetical protein [Anaerolineales bacterium]